MYSIRLRCWSALLRSVLYLFERNAAYNTPVWRIMRGVAAPESAIPVLERPFCCAVSGAESKIIAELSDYWGTDEYAPCSDSVVSCLTDVQMTFFGETLGLYIVIFFVQIYFAGWAVFPFTLWSTTKVLRFFYYIV